METKQDKYFMLKFLAFMALTIVFFRLLFPSPNTKKEEKAQANTPVAVAPSTANSTIIEKVVTKTYSNKNFDIQLDFSSNRITISKLVLKQYKDNNKNQYEVLNKENTMSFALDCGVSFCPNFADMKFEGNQLTYNKGGIIFTIDYNFNEDYSLDIIHKITNNNNGSVRVLPIITMENNDSKKESSFVYKGGISYINDNFEELKKDTVKTYQAVSGWIGFTDRYFENIFIINDPMLINFSKLKDSKKIEISNDFTVNPRETSTQRYTFFVGPKKGDVISNIEKKFNATRLDLSIDYGSFHVIAKPVAEFMNYLYSITGNMGIAIIILTILMRIVLFPLAQKSFKSSFAMKKLQPQIKAIQSIYKDDKMKMNQEVMKLYQKNKVSPAAGCLPLLLQIPIFFALYRVLIVDFSVRGAGFLYLNDLSLADPTSIFNLFGVLPYSIPAFFPQVGLLPILMGLTMYMQQKLQGSDATNQMPVLKYMPFIFVLIFGNLASGLILYWTISNLFAILQMFLLERSNKNVRS